MLSDALHAASSLENPIGVFDSGVGGLTVLKALRRALPQQDFVYLGDTARVPYGRKPREMVAQFALGITRFLLACGVQGVVVACNTASSAALPLIRAASSVPVWEVIEPGVEAARSATRNGQVGVIGTRGTIAAGAYQGQLERHGLSVWAQACPMFVPLVEEGLTDSPEARMLAAMYLADRPAIDTLILGCTHYPVLKKVIGQTVGDAVKLVDSAEVTAARVRLALEGQAGLERTPGRAGRILHFVTGDPLAYAHTAGVIGGVEGEIRALEVSVLSSLEAPTQAVTHSEALRG